MLYRCQVVLLSFLRYVLEARGFSTYVDRRMIRFSSVRRLNMTPNLASSLHRNRRAVACCSRWLCCWPPAGAAAAAALQRQIEQQHCACSLLRGNPTPISLTHSLTPTRVATLEHKVCCTKHSTSQTCILVRQRPGWPPASHTPAI